MMERSSRFISLSGLSGVVAGLTAIIGVVYVYFVFQREGINYLDGDRNILGPALVKELVLIGIAILVVAVLSGYIFTAHKKQKKRFEDLGCTTKRLLITFVVPLLAGGVFCLALLLSSSFVFIAPATLIFYGLALVAAERYTLTDVKYLGYLEIILGLISLFFLGWGLLFWAIGFWCSAYCLWIDHA